MIESCGGCGSGNDVEDTLEFLDDGVTREQPEMIGSYEKFTLKRFMTMVKSIHSPERWEEIIENCEISKKKRKEEKAKLKAEFEEKKKKIYTPKVLEEINRNPLKRGLEHVSEELKECKENLRIKSPYLYNSSLRTLKSLNSKVEELIQQSRMVPYLPPIYQTIITELDKGIRGAIKDFAVKAGEYSKTGGVSIEDAEFFRKIEKNAEGYMQRFIFSDPGETFSETMRKKGAEIEKINP